MSSLNSILCLSSRFPPTSSELLKSHSSLSIPPSLPPSPGRGLAFSSQDLCGASAAPGTRKGVGLAVGGWERR